MDYYIAIKLPVKDSISVKTAMEVLSKEYGEDMFSEVFKIITADNGSEFEDFKTLDQWSFKFTLLIRIYLGKELGTSATIDCSADMFQTESPLRIIPMNRFCGLLMKSMICPDVSSAIQRWRNSLMSSGIRCIQLSKDM